MEVVNFHVQFQVPNSHSEKLQYTRKQHGHFAAANARGMEHE